MNYNYNICHFLLIDAPTLMYMGLSIYLFSIFLTIYTFYTMICYLISPPYTPDKGLSLFYQIVRYCKCGISFSLCAMLHHYGTFLMSLGYRDLESGYNGYRCIIYFIAMCCIFLYICNIRY